MPAGFDLVGRADLQARAAFMGHKRLENTLRYSRLDPGQFEGSSPTPWQIPPTFSLAHMGLA